MKSAQCPAFQSRQSTHHSKSLKQTALSALFPAVTGGVSKKIMLSASGKELISRTIVKVRHAEYAALNGMTEEEKEALISVLDKFTRLLNEATHIIRE